jgi:hypothetical protein
MNLSTAALRKRFADLTKKHDAIRAKADPLRLKYDTLAQHNRKAEDAAAARVKDAEAGLFEIEQERATIARALGGKTSEPG